VVALVRTGVDNPICLPAPNLLSAVLGLIMDLLLDLFLVVQAYRLYSRSEPDARKPECIVLLSSVALFAWHLVYLQSSPLTLGFSSDLIPIW
jgi:hypothetical protein